jgi:hypothetical protein
MGPISGPHPPGRVCPGNFFMPIHDEVSDAVTRARRKGGKAFTLYKPQTVKRLLKAVSEGLTLKQAAIAAA